MRNGDDYAEALRLAHPNTNIGTKHVTTKSTKNTATRQHVPLQARANMVSWEQHPTKAILGNLSVADIEDAMLHRLSILANE